MIVLIDNGHGVNTPGKRSPDGRLREYKYAREIANRVVDRMKGCGVDARRIVTEEEDISLGERCRRVNAVCKEYGAKNVLLVSIHVNAAGNGKWMNARGWSAYTSVGQTGGDKLADCLYEAAELYLGDYAKTFTADETAAHQKAIRKDTSDGDPDIEASFYILKHTSCAAVLTENMFQDNKKDVAYLLSEDGRDAIVNIHCCGIEQYIHENE